MKQLHKILLVTATLCFSTLFAQQVTQFSQYQQSLSVMNPAGQIVFNKEYSKNNSCSYTSNKPC